LMDETGIPGVDPNGPTSANFILKHGGVETNASAFYCMLMRYNLADPTQPASITPTPNAKYILGTNFPGLTVGKILQNYPNAQTLWPSPATETPIGFGKSTSPVCK
jgi:hypothetical protein